MNRVKRFRKESLHTALALVPAGAWSPPSVYTATNGTHGYRVVSLVELGRRRPAAHLFGFVLDEFEPVWSAWLSSLGPGGFIVRHIDAGPYRERWHVPIQPTGVMNGRPSITGLAFRVEHWEPHSVENDTGMPRIHLVLDRERIVNPTIAPYRMENNES